MPEQLAQPVTRRSLFRFTIRDLLLFTAAVAVYLSSLLQLIRWAVTGAAGPSWLTIQITVAILVGGTLTALVWGSDRQIRLKLGANQIRWRRTWTWRTVIRLAFLCLLAAPFIAPFPAASSAFVGLLLACATFLFVPIRVGNNGVSYQVGVFIPWSRFDVDLNGANSTLTLKSSGTRWKWEHRLAIPVVHLEQVEEVLRENGKLALPETQLAPGDSPGG